MVLLVAPSIATSKVPLAEHAVVERRRTGQQVQAHDLVAVRD